MMSSPQPDEVPEVPMDVAYRAAQDRALRTVAALIVSEALALTLRAQLGRERAQYEGRITGMHKRIRDLIAEVSELRGEVTHDAADDEGESPVRPSYPPESFSD
jgi:hypothetical protein